MREQADMRAAIMVGSTFSYMLGTSSSASLLPTSGLPPLQVAAGEMFSTTSDQIGKNIIRNRNDEAREILNIPNKAAAVEESIWVPSGPKIAAMNFFLL